MTDRTPSVFFDGPKFKFEARKLSANVECKSPGATDFSPHFMLLVQFEVTKSHVKRDLPRSYGKGNEGYPRYLGQDQLLDFFHRRNLGLQGKLGLDGWSGHVGLYSQDEQGIFDQGGVRALSTINTGSWVLERDSNGTRILDFAKEPVQFLE